MRWQVPPGPQVRTRCCTAFPLAGVLMLYGTSTPAAALAALAGLAVDALHPRTRAVLRQPCAVLDQPQSVAVNLPSPCRLGAHRMDVHLGAGAAFDAVAGAAPCPAAPVPAAAVLLPGAVCKYRAVQMSTATGPQHQKAGPAELQGGGCPQLRPRWCRGRGSPRPAPRPPSPPTLGRCPATRPPRSPAAAAPRGRCPAAPPAQAAPDRARTRTPPGAGGREGEVRRVSGTHQAAHGHADNLGQGPGSQGEETRNRRSTGDVGRKLQHQARRRGAANEGMLHEDLLLYVYWFTTAARMQGNHRHDPLTPQLGCSCSCVASTSLPSCQARGLTRGSLASAARDP